NIMFKTSVVPENTVVTYTSLSGNRNNLSTATSFVTSNEFKGREIASKVECFNQSPGPSLGDQRGPPMYLEQLRNKDHPYFKERYQHIDHPHQNIVRRNYIGFDSSFPSPPPEYDHNIDENQASINSQQLSNNYGSVASLVKSFSSKSKEIHCQGREDSLSYLDPEENFSCRSRDGTIRSTSSKESVGSRSRDGTLRSCSGKPPKAPPRHMRNTFSFMKSGSLNSELDDSIFNVSSTETSFEIPSEDNQVYYYQDLPSPKSITKVSIVPMSPSVAVKPMIITPQQPINRDVPPEYCKSSEKRDNVTILRTNLRDLPGEMCKILEQSQQPDCMTIPRSPYGEIPDEMCKYIDPPDQSNFPRSYLAAPNTLQQRIRTGGIVNNNQEKRENYNSLKNVSFDFEPQREFFEPERKESVLDGRDFIGLMAPNEPPMYPRFRLPPIHMDEDYTPPGKEEDDILPKMLCFALAIILSAAILYGLNHIVNHLNIKIFNMED
ncbi:unnamed protein product, partial [Meganyctiphanes norvegica]